MKIDWLDHVLASSGTVPYHLPSRPYWERDDSFKLPAIHFLL